MDQELQGRLHQTVSAFVENYFSAAIGFDSILQTLNSIKINFESDHGDIIFSSFIILLYILNLESL